MEGTLGSFLCHLRYLGHAVLVWMGGWRFVGRTGAERRESYFCWSLKITLKVHYTNCSILWYCYLYNTAIKHSHWMLDSLKETRLQGNRLPSGLMTTRKFPIFTSTQFAILLNIYWSHLAAKCLVKWIFFTSCSRATFVLPWAELPSPLAGNSLEELWRTRGSFVYFMCI